MQSASAQRRVAKESRQREARWLGTLSQRASRAGVGVRRKIATPISQPQGADSDRQTEHTGLCSAQGDVLIHWSQSPAVGT